MKTFLLPVSALLIAIACNESRNAASTERSAPVAMPAPTAGVPATQASTATAEDSLIFDKTIQRAKAERLDTLPIGDIIATVGQWFVGAPYVPSTLEQPGKERLVINLREFDCVTFVENMLSFGRVIRAGKTDFGSFKRQIEQIRYRGGKLDGYLSRLHYFSEWIADNEKKGILKNETRALGGVVDNEPIEFMTLHAGSYRQLAEPGVTEEVAKMQQRVSAMPRYMIPEDKIASVEKGIHNGDIIAATSNLKGLDVAHTGIALWVNGRLHLMHAPLVGTRVEISKVPLAERIKDIEKQDGIMVARPL